MIANDTYIVDFKKLVRWLTAYRLRKPRLLAWLYLLIKPIIFTYQLFLRYRKSTLYNLKITGQVCYLELLLNDFYDFTNRGIYIEDAIDKPTKYIFTRAENKPKYIGRRSESKRLIIYTRGESGGTGAGFDFIVYVPMSVVFDVAEMTSLIKIYRLVGMRFKIQRY